MTQILYPEWRAQHDATRYPFSERATLSNADGRFLPEGMFLDAALYPIGAQAGLYLSQVVIDHAEVTLHIGDADNAQRASVTFDLVQPPATLVLTDAYDRPAGILVSESVRLAIFQSWGVGTHTFTRDQTEFCATVCFPTPEVGVRGLRLEDGTLLTGEIWLVGDDGVVIRSDETPLPATCTEPARRLRTIRVDVVGDPLFRRRLCVPAALFTTPRFVKTVRVVGPNQTFDWAVDARGNFQITSHGGAVPTPVLRLNTIPEGLRIQAVGSVIKDR